MIKNDNLLSGFNDLDSLTNGFCRKDLVVIAGKRNTGKTSFLLDIIINNALKFNKKAVLFNTELGSKNVVLRMLRSISEVNFRKKDFKFNEINTKKLTDAAKKLYNCCVFIDDKPDIIFNKLADQISFLNDKVKIDFVVIDFLELISTNEECNEKYSIITKSLKNLAVKLNITIILSILLNNIDNINEKIHKQGLANLNKTNNIEKNSDVIIFISEKNTGQADRNQELMLKKFIILKNRNAGTGEVLLTFNKEYIKYNNY